MATAAPLALLLWIPSIVGGAAVEPGDWPTVLALDTHCTATLVSEDTILFAAHCDLPRRAFFGENATQPESTIDVDDCRRAPEPLDFATCRLAIPVRDRALVALATSKDIDQLDPGASITLVGFGDDGRGAPGRKRAATTSLNCLTPGGELHIGGEGIDACVGDSGGPAFARIGGDWRLVGVVTRGGRCGRGGYFGRADIASNWLAGRGLDGALAKHADVEPPHLSLDPVTKEGDTHVFELDIEDSGCGPLGVDLVVNGRPYSRRPARDGGRVEIRLVLGDGRHDVEFTAVDRALNRSRPLTLDVATETAETDKGTGCTHTSPDNGAWLLGLLFAVRKKPRTRA